MNTAVPTIMVVEDEELLLNAITTKIKLSNLDVISCASGKQALDYLGSLPKLPDAIWLDYYLSDMTGITFMDQIKAHPEWSQIPIIVVSNSASPEKVELMINMGAKGYILKADHRLDEIIENIKTYIPTKNDSKTTNTA